MSPQNVTTCHRGCPNEQAAGTSITATSVPARSHERVKMTFFPYLAVARQHNVPYCVVLWLSDQLDAEWPTYGPMPRCSCVAIKLYSMGWRAVGNRNNSGMANRARSATRENVAIPAPLRRTAPRAISLLHRIRWNPLKPHVCGAERSPRRAQIAAEASRIRDASDRPARLSSLQC